MIQPILCIFQAIQPGRLNVDVLVSWIEVDVPDRCNIACLLVRDVDGLEEGWRDEAISL